MNILKKICRSCAFSEPCRAGNPPAIGECSVTPTRRDDAQRNWLLKQITKKIKSQGGHVILRKSVKVLCDDVSGPFVKIVRIISMPADAQDACMSFDIGDGDTSMQLRNEDLRSILQQL